MEILESITNQYAGVVLSPEALPTDAEAFRQRLHHSLQIWRDQGLKLVWVEVPVSKSQLIPIAVDAGFTYHHSDPKYLMLTYPLLKDTLIPAYASHYIGMGGVVLNSNRELLVVSERYRRDKSRPYYKLPGGQLHQGEHIADGIVREVYEETGIRAQFESVVCFRHWHGYRYGKSDIYFICRLSPLTLEIDPQDDELDECLWMPVADYLNNDYVAVFNRKIVEAALNGPGVSPTTIEGYADAHLREFFMPNGM